MVPISEKRKAEIAAKYAPRLLAHAQEHERKLEAERLAAEAAKPKRALIVSEKFAEAAKAYPEDVRLSARTSNDEFMIERPRRTEIIDVLEVDAEGRPAVGRRHDLLTGEKGVVGMTNGYYGAGKSGAVHEYDPLSALRRDD